MLLINFKKNLLKLLVKKAIANTRFNCSEYTVNLLFKATSNILVSDFEHISQRESAYNW